MIADHREECCAHHAQESRNAAVEMLEARIEIVTLKLENNQRTSDLEKLAFEVTFKHPDIAKEVTELLKMLDAASGLTDQFGKELLEDDENSARESERMFVEFELIEAREDGELKWIPELESELREVEAEDTRNQVRREMFEVKRNATEESRDSQSRKRRYDQATRETKEAAQAGELSEKRMDRPRECFEQEHREDDGEGKDQ